MRPVFVFDASNWKDWPPSLVKSYGTLSWRHLGFPGTGDRTQMLLITDYHRHGSLYDFLKNNTIDEDRMVVLKAILTPRNTKLSWKTCSVDFEQQLKRGLFYVYPIWLPRGSTARHQFYSFVFSRRSKSFGVLVHEKTLDFWRKVGKLRMKEEDDSPATRSIWTHDLLIIWRVPCHCATTAANLALSWWLLKKKSE